MGMLEWALDYADQGIAVFPLHTIISGECSCGISDCSSPGKHPIYARGVLAHGVKEATKDKELIKRWWSRWPEANIGVATGLVSGLFVVDVDGELGKKTMRKLQRRYGKLRTRIAQTGNGVHLFSRSGGREIKNHVGIVPGVDIRGCGGYVVAPPSKHVAGKRYVFSNELGLSDAPGWVIQMVTPKRAAATHTPQRDRDGPKDPQFINQIPDGQRNKKLSMIAIGLVKYQNYSESDLGNYMEEVNRTKCRPPVNDRELRGICRKALRYK
mgnify:CR=1 FL=1